MAYTQENRFIALDVPESLGKDDLLLSAFRGTEGISRLFSFEVVALFRNQEIAFEDIMGKSVTISVVLADDSKRYFNGIVSKFVQMGQDKSVQLAEYRATVVPWLWLLTLTEDSKIFQAKSVPEIVEAVFNKRGFQSGAHYALRLHGTYEKRTYCVQYRESDFNFVSRLLEDEGIHYFFEHEEGKHVMVLADDPAENKSCPQQQTARFQRTAAGWAEEDVVQEFQKRMEVVPTGVTLNDYNFETPMTDLKTNVANQKKLTDRDCEVYDYPGCYEKIPGGRRLVNLRMQEEEARIATFTGVSNCRAFTSGQQFELVDHFRADVDGKKYVLTHIVHEAVQKLVGSKASGEGADYRNLFTCIPADVPFRPLRETPRPVIRGTQTAIVVGPSGEEIYTDKHGRVKVQFHWDRLGKRNEDSSCWIRVAQIWAGSGWGGMYIPRIGQEVVVDFLEGDPDRPIVIGCVYHGTNTPPYPLPDEKTKSLIKSDSSLGGGGFNEIRFEDKKGEEQFFFHAEKNLDIRVKKDSFAWTGNDRHLIIKNEQFDLVEKDKHLSVKGNYNEKVEGIISIKGEMDMQEKVGMKYALDAGQEIHLKAGMNIIIEGNTNISLSAGGSFITIGPAGVDISGAMVKINSGGAAGCGSGSSPEAPKLPKEADKAQPGKKSPPPQAQAQAAALKSAAQSGMPFCDI